MCIRDRYNHDVGSYHYNFATGQELSNPEMLAHLGYTDDAKVCLLYTSGSCMV